MKKICFITTSRADFGTLDELVKEAIKKKSFSTQLIISGTHTNSIFGETAKEIINKKRYTIKKIKINVKNENSYKVAKSFAECIEKFSEILKKTKPNLFIVFGDRYEMFAATIAAYILRIPIAHIAGGEKTSGSIDEGFRHSITKLSNIHFPAMDIYKKRLIQLGEDPKTIFSFGSLNIEKIKKNKYLKKFQLEKKMKIKFYEKNLIFTYHPETVDINKSIKNLFIALKALKKIKKTLIIITSPNADAQGILMINFIKRYIKKNKIKNFLFYKSLGSQTYLSLLKIVDGVVGNSSSGVSEVPFFKIGTVNIGDRQKGRFIAKSVINCPVSEASIINSINRILSNKFKRKIKTKSKIYTDRNVAKKIIKRLLSFDFKKYNKKIFYDIKNR